MRLPSLSQHILSLNQALIVSLSFVIPYANRLKVTHRPIVKRHNPLKILPIHRPPDAAGIRVLVLFVMNINRSSQIEDELFILIRQRNQ